MRISVVIPTFNNWRLTKRCVDAVIALTAPELLAEIVVVDDASTDGVSARWTAAQNHFTPLLLARNNGFSGACNAGATRCSGDAILFLNNDAFVRAGSLAAMRDTLREDSGIGIVGARLLYSDGSLQHAGLALLPGAVSRWWHIHKRRAGTLADANVARDFLAVTGAALLIRRELFAQLGGFDEGFINGWEDVDLCLRSWRAGARVRYEPRAVLEHLESATLGRENDHGRNERRFVDRWQTLLEHVPRYPLAEVPPIALAGTHPRAPNPTMPGRSRHITRWWKAHLGASVLRTRPGSRLDRARVEFLAAVARRRPTLEVSWNAACLAPATGPKRVAFVAPRSAVDAHDYAQAVGVSEWWTPSDGARDAMLEAGCAPDRVTVVRLGTQTVSPPERFGVAVVAAAPSEAALLVELQERRPQIRVVTLRDDPATLLDAVDIVLVSGRADPYGLALTAAIGHGCSVVTCAPVDALAAASPGVTVVEDAQLLDALVARVDAVAEVRALAHQTYLDARRRLDAYLATQHVSELARAITGGTPSASVVQVDGACAKRLAGVQPVQRDRPAIAAHLIVGRNEESFLPALLRSLESVADRVVVNDNSEDPTGPNARALAESSFARRGALIVDRAPFVDSPTRAIASWPSIVAWISAIGPLSWMPTRCIGRSRQPLHATSRACRPMSPSSTATRGTIFNRSRLYTSIERRMSFFRVTPELQWSGRVHEHLTGVAGKHLAIPYVYDHYGAVFSMHLQAAKGRQYSSLGQAGPTVAEKDEATVREVDYFRSLWPLVLRYHGDHPAAVRELQHALEATERVRYRWSERTAAQFQPPHVRVANLARRANFEYRWRGRALDPRALGDARTRLTKRHGAISPQIAYASVAPRPDRSDCRTIRRDRRKIDR